MWIRGNQRARCVRFSTTGSSRKVILKMTLVIRLRLTLVAGFLSLFVLSHEAAEHPNVLWIVVDDMSPNFSCYGETVIQTPHVDRLATEGVRFTRVCHLACMLDISVCLNHGNVSNSNRDAPPSKWSRQASYFFACGSEATAGAFSRGWVLHVLGVVYSTSITVVSR